nr:MAG TPA: hypothetical protein [Caudoviricetes sp.]
MRFSKKNLHKGLQCAGLFPTIKVKKEVRPTVRGVTNYGHGKR